MTEEFALGKVLGNASTVNRKEGMLSTWAGEVDQSGKFLLTGAGFTRDQGGHVKRGILFSELHGLAKCGVLADETRRRVVIVEDNPDIRETLRMLLDLWGHEVAMASDGRSGVDRVLQERPDIALIDVGLPGMSGYDVARAIRETLPDGGIRLIAVTGYGQPSDQELAMQAGFDTHLLKPISPTVLQRLLAE